MTEQDWPVVRYRGARDNQGKPARWDWATLRRALCQGRTHGQDKVSTPAWSPVEMVEGKTRRAAANVAAVSMLVLDCDAGDPLDVLESLGDEYIRIGHTSWSHTPDHPKARLVFPFERPCPVVHWERVWGAAARWAASQGVTVDPAAKDPSRLYFGAYVPRIEGAEPGGNEHLEWFECWCYSGSPDGSPVGLMPARERGYLSWARLASAYPEPEPEPQVYAAHTGALADTADERERRRRTLAAGIIRHRCGQIQAHGKGGRNVRLYAAARTAGSLAAGGWLDLSAAAGDLEAAGLASGLGAKEVARAIRNGLAHGDADGPYDIDSNLTEAAT